MKDLLISVLLMTYVLYSLVHSMTFYRKDKYYPGKYKILHIILIWLIPFLYVLLLKELGYRAPGSHHYDKINRNLGQKGNNDVEE